MGVIVESNVRVAQRGIFIRRLCVQLATAQDHAQAGNHFLQRKRLGHVVVRADGQAVDAVFHRIFGGEVEHWAVETVGA